MSIEARKLELVNYILQVQNEALLEKVKSIFEQEAVVSSLSGASLTRLDYLSELKEAEEEMKSGDDMSHEAVKEAVDKW